LTKGGGEREKLKTRGLQEEREERNKEQEH